MTNLLEITGNDIAQLDDSTLRELIGLLCEADYRLGGLSTKGILWGGNQDAPDGGLDVVVRSEDSPPNASAIPRKITGFQVKKPDMPRAKIIAEMRPNGFLRDEIKTLIKENGAYIIVSSSGSTTDKALQNRIEAIREAVSKEDSNNILVVDFFDRNRIATWVRLHPSIILWVRSKIGRNLVGWRPYDNWANAPGGIEEDYLLDDSLRLHDETLPQEREVSIEGGLLRLRATLSVPGSSVRLAGLSGVGKTRLVQALFDERVGSQTLNHSLAFYTDISDNSEPNPQAFAEQLIARVAISLANTVERNETLSGFRDEELFKRLFWQREMKNESLLISAEACSLVYSFEGTDTQSDESELDFLASLVNKTSLELYRLSSEIISNR